MLLLLYWTAADRYQIAVTAAMTVCTALTLCLLHQVARCSFRMRSPWAVEQDTREMWIDTRTFNRYIKWTPVQLTNAERILLCLYDEHSRHQSCSVCIYICCFYCRSGQKADIKNSPAALAVLLICSDWSNSINQRTFSSLEPCELRQPRSHPVRLCFLCFEAAHRQIKSL